MPRTITETVEALSASCLPCELAQQQSMAADVQTEPEQSAKWEGILTFEGQKTGDGRIIETNALRWDTLPVPLRWVGSDVGGHDGAVVVGRITDIERRDNGAIYAIGDFDLGSEMGREAARQVQEGLTPGVSVDLDEVSFEVRVASEASEYLAEDQIEMAAEPDEEGRVKVLSGNPDDELTITTGARIRAATLVAIPAFEAARITLTAGLSEHQWRAPKGTPDIAGEWIDMPSLRIEAFLDSSGGPDNPAMSNLYSAADRLDQAVDSEDLDALSSAYNDLNVEAETLNLRENPGYQDAIAPVEAALDNGFYDPSSHDPLPEGVPEGGLLEEGDPAQVQEPPVVVNDALHKALQGLDSVIANGNDETPPNLSRLRDLMSDLRDSGAAPEVLQEYIDLVKRWYPDFGAGSFSLSSDELGVILEEFNWVEDTGTGHLPQYIKRIAKHLEKEGMTKGHAIATAVNAVEKACATGDLNYPGVQHENTGSQAEACEAVAEWEAKKAEAHANAAAAEIFREVSTEEREKLSEKNEALPDGSFPIANVDDLKNAIQALGRAKDPEAAKAHIKRRAKELGQEGLIPENWAVSAYDLESIKSRVKEPAQKGPIGGAGAVDVVAGGGGGAGGSEGTIEVTLVAGGFPLQPPASWFSNPKLDGPTPLKVTEDGHVYGHIAVWGTCHTGYPGQCVTPPNSSSNYAYFRTGSVYADDGKEYATGVITMDTLHAGKTLSAASTLAHYENTGHGAADVNVGDDSYGIWVSGALRSTVTNEQAKVLRASPLSGDWRRIGGNLELVAALAVNVPGFPIPRPQGLVAGGAMQSLVASGMLAPETPKTRKGRRVQRKALSEEDYAYLKRLADRERRMAEDEVAVMAREVTAADLARSIGV